MPTPRTGQAEEVHELKITLSGSQPPIWRRVAVPSDCTLAELHEIIQIAMGWMDEHLHQFRLKTAPRRLEREEQARIKARLREEQQLQKEIDQELKRLEREREVVKAALEKALADAQQQHTEEVERLETRLAEAEAKIQRAVSQAQLTRSGHVYVISNIGSFGENMYKIGMTRRLEPEDRVRELGDASVPFPFDVHMMVYSEDAPSLENALHQALHKTRVNKLKPRKEFYRTDLDSIVRIVRENQGEVEYRADPEALQYRQSLVATDEDLEVVEAAWDEHQEHD
jgi:DNA repair exonuclease SbcCD ATPase subunit